MNGSGFCELSLIHSYPQEIRFRIVWCIPHLYETRKHGIKALLSHAFSDKACAANITAYPIFLLLKMSETEDGGENEHHLHLKRRKNNCIGQIVRRNRLLQQFIQGKMAEMRRRKGRRKQLYDDLEKKKIHRNLKAQVQDRSVRRSHFSRGCHKTDNVLIVQGQEPDPLNTFRNRPWIQLKIKFSVCKPWKHMVECRSSYIVIKSFQNLRGTTNV